MVLTSIIGGLVLGHLPLRYGKSVVNFECDQVPIETYCYKPDSYQGKRIIVVMHGVLRNADEYRDHSVQMAERFGALIITPKFDSQRFPSRLYQRGGILNADGSAAPAEKWTYAYLPKIIAQVRKREGANIPFWIIGHSAGGQFLVRMCAFTRIGAERVIAANAGSHLFPTVEAPFGYGYGSLPESLRTDEVMKQYLSAPLTLFQGTGDNKPDENFDQSADAMKQGGGRYQRGQAVYAFAKNLAQKRGWKFNWKWVEAKGVVHDHEAMFNHPNCELALFGTKSEECGP